MSVLLISLPVSAVVQVLADWHRSCIVDSVNVLLAFFAASGDACLAAGYAMEGLSSVTHDRFGTSRTYSDEIAVTTRSGSD